MILCSDKFLDTMPKAEYMKEKKKSFIKLKILCSVKDKCQQNGKTGHRLGENIFKRHF